MADTDGGGGQVNLQEFFDKYQMTPEQQAELEEIVADSVCKAFVRGEKAGLSMSKMMGIAELASIADAVRNR